LFCSQQSSQRPWGSFRDAVWLDFWSIIDLYVYLSLVLRWFRYPFPCNPEICQDKKQLRFEVVLADTPVEDFPEAKLTFNDPKEMPHFGAEVCFRRFNQIQKLALCCHRKHSALAGLHYNSDHSLTVLEITTFLNADVACIAVDEVFLSMEPVFCRVQLMNMRRCSTE
jgi:hypothetical protein